jgi:hypothetical protein
MAASFPPSSRVTLFEIGRGAGEDALSGRDRSGEADDPSERVAGHERTEPVVAADDVEHARGEDVSENLANEKRGE